MFRSPNREICSQFQRGHDLVWWVRLRVRVRVVVSIRVDVRVMVMVSKLLGCD